MSRYPVRRLTSNFLVAVSFLLCISLLTDRCLRRGHMDWVEFMVWRTDGTTLTTTEFSLTTKHGIAIIDFGGFASDIDVRVPRNHFDYGTLIDTDDNWVMGDSLLGRAGFEIRVTRLTSGLTKGTHWVIFRNIGMPIWFLVLLCGIAPAARLLKWRKRRHRLKQGLCIACGYDLRETSDRCPECGATASENVASLISRQ